MHQSINFTQFHDAFRSMGREGQFSYAGLRALFEYLEEMEEACGEPLELDVIALCCDFSEHDSPLDAALEYSFEKPEMDEGEDVTDYVERCNDEALDYLRENTSVIEMDNGSIIIQNY